ncbi:MAG: sodium-dependent transporter [Kiritimatiellae bacterium]|jgi:NSS family neurotransmitter:Na+ symporter|nr:sodium-dependent transporter [Kiritimatiellia bacterium]
MPDNKREHWGSSLGFILAAAGSAVGLGNIWKFPYVTGENGGGAFVLIYLLCILLIGFPLMLAELTIGRKTQKNPIGAFRDLMPKNCMVAHLIGIAVGFTGLLLFAFKQWGWGTIFILLSVAIFKLGWSIVGYMGVFCGFVILSFYSVVGGWVIGYIVEILRGTINFETTAQAKDFFVGNIGNPVWSVSYHIIFMIACIALVMSGLKKGIELSSKILMPVLLGLLIILIIRGISLPGAKAGITFYLSPDFSKITGETVLIALGHAFFSLSLGMGAILTYGSYLDKKQNLYKSTLSIVALDTIIALLAGLAMFPAVFAYGGSPEAGPGLVFQVIPTVFNKMPAGSFWIFVFFFLIFIAALTSAISLLEVVTSAMMDELKFSRHLATLTSGILIILLGLLSAVSVTGWENIPWVETVMVKLFNCKQGNFFDVADNLASNWLLPLGGMFISIFTGWIWGTTYAIKEIREGSPEFANVNIFVLLAGLKDDPKHNPEKVTWTLATTWGIFIRFLSPVAVTIAFLYTIGWI